MYVCICVCIDTHTHTQTSTAVLSGDLHVLAYSTEGLMGNGAWWMHEMCCYVVLNNSGLLKMDILNVLNYFIPLQNWNMVYFWICI
jgi:hypothetical protein